MPLGGDFQLEAIAELPADETPANNTANGSLHATVTVTATAVGNGTVARSPDQATYEAGSTVQLTATPASGYHLVGWTGDVTSAANPLSVPLTGNLDVTATFAINTYALTVTTVGSGSVTKNPDLPAYNHGTTVQLTAVPAPADFPAYQPRGGILANLCYYPRSRLYLMGIGLMAMAACLVLGFGPRKCD